MSDVMVPEAPPDADAEYWQGCWSAVSQRARDNAAERDEAIKERDAARNTADFFAHQAKKTLAEKVEIREAFKKYGDHTLECDLSPSNWHLNAACTCGFEDARRQILGNNPNEVSPV